MPNTTCDRDALLKMLRRCATITLDALPEDQPVRGNVTQSGDADADTRAEDATLEDLESNPWAWTCARVRATFLGFEGTDYLGCCSYKSEEDFKHPHGYYQDMVATALDELADQIIENSDQFSELATTMPDTTNPRDAAPVYCATTLELARTRDALRELLEYCKGNRGLRGFNPYGVQSVRVADALLGEDS